MKFEELLNKLEESAENKNWVIEKLEEFISIPNIIDIAKVKIENDLGILILSSCINNEISFIDGLDGEKNIILNNLDDELSKIKFREIIDNFNN